MQLMLILGIAFAIGAVVFALQNDGVVVVTLAVWSFEGSQAIVLLLALGLGVLITGLLTTPAVIRAQWAAKRLRRQVADLEREVADYQKRQQTLSAELEQHRPASATAEKPYVGLRTLLGGEPPPV